MHGQGAWPSGRRIARRLRGKHKAIYTPHVDTGDFIVVVNVEKLRVTGNKAQDKKYYRHSGYPGGIYETNFTKLQQRFPGSRAGEGGQGHAAQGPAGLRDAEEDEVLRGAEHPHTAQQPKFSRSKGADMAVTYNYGTGRRKTAVARVFHQEGHRQHRRQWQAGR
jgi:large subunit ribosomal protein L13